MDYIIAITIVIIIVLMWLLWRPRALEPHDENLVNIVEKYVPSNQTTSRDAVVIDSIPFQEPAQQNEAEDAPVVAVNSDEKPHIALTFDAAVARYALMRSRDKRMYDAIANRTTDYYRPFFEEEIHQCDNRDWWDDVAYPMNDSGENVITPEQSPSDRVATPWDSESVPFARTI